MKQILLEEFPELYETHMKRDFPKNELRTLQSIQQLYEEGSYHGWGLYNNEELVAYALLIGQNDGSPMLLDYFAVIPSYRNSGLGGRFLRELGEQQNTSGLIIECEQPKKGKDLQEQQTRVRRIQFYLRNGAQLVDIGWRVVTVSYNILWLPVTEKTPPSTIGEELKKCYGRQWNPFMRRLCTHCYHLDSSKSLEL